MRRTTTTRPQRSQITVLKATPVITWVNPADIVYGTALSATQLNATADVAGSFIYTPAAGVKLNVGANQTLSVTFTPTDAANYNDASKTVQINVIYQWDGFLQPINDTAHDLGPMSKFKAGQTIPAKFVLKNAAGAVVQQTGVPTFTRTSVLAPAIRARRSRLRSSCRLASCLSTSGTAPSITTTGARRDCRRACIASSRTLVMARSARWTSA